MLLRTGRAERLSAGYILRLAGWLLAGVLLIVLVQWYAQTMPPGVSSFRFNGWSDLAEFQMVGAYWGLEHSPGYPLYTVLSNLLVRAIGFVAPQTEPAWRVSFFSLLAGVGALVFCFLLLLRLAVHSLLAASATFFFGTTELFWRHAIVAEVYMLNLLLILLALWLALCWPTAGHESRGGADSRQRPGI
ncbi:MAG: protein O-mannosyl-transferase family, partial [Candidatus Binatia bacterium]